MLSFFGLSFFGRTTACFLLKVLRSVSDRCPGLSGLRRQLEVAMRVLGASNPNQRVMSRIDNGGALSDEYAGKDRHLILAIIGIWP